MIHNVTPVTARLFPKVVIKALFEVRASLWFLSVLITCLVLLTSPAQARNPRYFPLAVITGHDSRVMTKPSADDGGSPALFYEVLRKSLKKRKTNIETICPASDAVARRVLEDYGAIFLARKVLPPPVCG